MDTKLSAVTLALMSGICFVSGLIILSTDDKGGAKPWTDSKQSYTH